jgi:arylsulfate sulfotransferase
MSPVLRMKMVRIFSILSVLLLTACGGGGGGSNPVLGDSLGLSPTNIELDPFGTAPLSARLSFTTPIAGVVTITVQGKQPGGIDISHEFDQPATNFVIPVLGLYANFMNTVIVDFVADDGQTTQDILPVTTAPLPVVDTGPVMLPVTINIIENNLPVGDASLYMFSQQKSAFDQTGAVRWAYRGEGWQFYRLLPNGNWLGNLNANQISYHFEKFAEFTMLGERIEASTYTVPNYLHHEVQKLPSGNYLVASNTALIDFAEDGVPEEDVLVEISAETGQVVKTWDFNLILDPTRPPIPSNSRPDDWLHLNAAAYDASDDSIIITAQRQSLVAKIDYQTAELQWILGAHEDWSVQFQDKLLAPVDDQGSPVDPDAVDFWPYGPHAAGPIDGGKIHVFDNGQFRGWYADNSVPGESYSRGVEYLVDEDNMTVQITWQFDSDQRFTPFTGDIDYLANGNYLIGFAWGTVDNDAPRIVEVDRDGNIVFEAVINNGEQEYRAEKFNLYDGL